MPSVPACKDFMREHRAFRLNLGLNIDPMELKYHSSLQLIMLITQWGASLPKEEVFLPGAGRRGQDVG